jgi:hypothetical protein
MQSFLFPDLTLKLNPNDVFNPIIVERIKTRKQYITTKKQVEKWKNKVPKEYADKVKPLYNKTRVDPDAPRGPPPLPTKYHSKKFIKDLTHKDVINNNLITYNANTKEIDTTNFLDDFNSKWGGKRKYQIIIPKELQKAVKSIMPDNPKIRIYDIFSLDEKQENIYNAAPWIPAESKNTILIKFVNAVKFYFKKNPDTKLNVTFEFADGSKL